MRIISWNIRTGGGQRVKLIARQICQWKADLVALSEFRATRFSQLLAGQLDAIGLNNQLTTARMETPTVNSLLIASRFQLKQIRISPDLDSNERWLLTKVKSGHELTVGVMHVPNRASGLKYDFLDSIVNIASKWNFGHGFLLGDTNSGIPILDEENRVLNKREGGWFKSLETEGWYDMFCYKYGDKKIFSWYSPNGDNGFRLDQVFANQESLPYVKDIKYKWGKSSSAPDRRDALSDHAAIIVDYHI